MDDAESCVSSGLSSFSTGSKFGSVGLSLGLVGEATPSLFGFSVGALSVGFSFGGLSDCVSIGPLSDSVSIGALSDGVSIGGLSDGCMRGFLRGWVAVCLISTTTVCLVVILTDFLVDKPTACLVGWMTVCFDTCLVDITGFCNLTNIYI